MVPAPLDLRHQGAERVIASYLLDTEDGLALFDCGPATDIGALKEGLRARGVELRDIRHLLLSHIHLDHAGAAGVLVREHPEMRVHVSEIGAPHLIDPSRLEASARRLYGETFDTLWGELAPVPDANVEVVGENVVGLECFPAPGHASHHVVYVDRDGTAYCGDAAGVRIDPHPYVVPPTPPPEVDIDAWHLTIEELRRHAPDRLALIHFGVAPDVGRHLDELDGRLDAWAELIAADASETEFAAAATADLEPDAREQYERAMPLWQSYAGLARWAEQRVS